MVASTGNKKESRRLNLGGRPLFGCMEAVLHLIHRQTKHARFAPALDLSLQLRPSILLVAMDVSPAPSSKTCSSTLSWSPAVCDDSQFRTPPRTPEPRVATAECPGAPDKRRITVVRRQASFMESPASELKAPFKRLKTSDDDFKYTELENTLADPGPTQRVPTSSTDSQQGSSCDKKRVALANMVATEVDKPVSDRVAGAALRNSKALGAD